MAAFDATERDCLLSSHGGAENLAVLAVDARWDVDGEFVGGELVDQIDELGIAPLDVSTQAGAEKSVDDNRFVKDAGIGWRILALGIIVPTRDVPLFGELQLGLSVGAQFGGEEEDQYS